MSDGGDDFASQVGIGAVISHQVHLAEGHRPPDRCASSRRLRAGPGKEAFAALRWATLYREHMPPRGEYRGELYDIGFDKPEAHAIAKDGAMYYAFYAERWTGHCNCCGLGRGRACATCSPAATWARWTRARTPCRRASIASCCCRRRRTAAPHERREAGAARGGLRAGDRGAVGRMGALSALSAQHGFPLHAGVLRGALTMIPPAVFILWRGGRLDAARARSPTAC